MSFNNGPRTVTTGLSLLVDAADPLSYPGSGTSWTDIVTGITGSLSGSITYASDFKGALVVNDSSSVIIFPTSSGNFGTDSFTVELAFQPNQINGQHWLISKNSGSLPSWGAFITGSGGSGRVTAFFNASSTVSCSMSTPTGSIVTGSNYLVDINFLPSITLNTIYLNSELSGSVIANGSGSLTATSSLFISNRNSGSSVGSPLEIFNAKLYTPRLVAGRIRQNYNSLSTRLNLPQKSFLPIVEDGLLNLYPGAAAAYSLRSLNSNYTGSAIRVRESIGNTEQNIGFDAFGNLDTSALTSFCGSGNGFVTTWYDQSGNARNATQTTAANQPQIVNAGSVLMLNSKPRLSYDGTNDFFNHTLNIASGYSLLLGVVKSLYNGTAPKGIYGVTAPSNILMNGLISNANSTEWGEYTNDWITSGYSIFNNQFSIQSYSDNSTTNPALNTLVTNNNVVNRTSTGRYAGDGSERRYIGDNFGNYFQGDMQELIAYNSDQSSNRTGIETNINDFYSIY